MTYIATAAILIGTGVSVYGQMQAADAAESQAEYNAALARQQAAHETDIAKENAARRAQDNARFIGAQRAQVASRGLSMEGTPLAVLGETVSKLELDLADISYEATLKSRAHLISAEQSIAEGQQAAYSMRVGAIASGIQGVGSAGMGYTSASGKTLSGASAKSPSSYLA